MAYTLENFCEDSRAALQADGGSAGRDKVRTLLEKLLVDQEFVDAYLGDGIEIGTTQIHEDTDLNFCVLTYKTDEPRTSPPHDHGNTWAIYGQVSDYTDMTVWKRTDGGTGGGDAKVEPVKTYRLEPGHAGLYDVGELHSIDYPGGARFVRVTGKDMAKEDRIVYDTDAGKANVIKSVGTN